MIPKDLMMLNLKRNEIDYQAKAREALVNADEALKRKDLAFARQLIDVVFSSLSSTQELQLTVLLLTEFFSPDQNLDQSRLNFFINLFAKIDSRKFVLLKFIITAIATGNGPALNAAGTYLLDPQMKDLRVSADLNRLLISEINYFSNSSIEKLSALPVLSPLFTNSLCLIFAETSLYKGDEQSQLPSKIIVDLVTLSTSPFAFCFSIPAHVETGALIIGTFFKWDVMSEIYEENPYSYSQLHLKILNEMTNAELTAKPIVYTKYMEAIVDQLQRANLKVKDPERVQRAIERFAQLIQVSKNYLYGNIPSLYGSIRKKLPKNPLMELVLNS